MQKSTQKYIVHDENELDNIDLYLDIGDRIFFTGDLGTGKSTFIRHILRKYTNNPSLVVRSPTYTYYQRYSQEIMDKRVSGGNIQTTPYLPPPVYHFDLYRLEDYDTFISIGGEEILGDSNTIVLIEWPEILGNTVKYTKRISIEVMKDGEREITVETILGS